MKTQILILFVLLSAIGYTQNAPNGINYKALIKDDSGNVIANTTVQIQFTIVQDVTNVYTETHSPTTDANGIIIVNIGEGTATSGDFNTINWATTNHSLNVQIDTGNGLVDVGTTQFMHVPYAIHAENVTGLEAIDEGNGMGWRLVGKNPDSYGNIGLNAVDLSHSVSGENSGALGQSSFSSGFRSIASGSASTTLGNLTSATNFASTALGNGTKASDANSLATGFRSTASGFASTAMGNDTEAIGYSSTAMGNFTRSQAAYNTVIGRFNLGTGNSTTWDEGDPLFEIGNGTSNSNRSNALTILKDGSLIQNNSDNISDELIGTGVVAFGNNTSSAGNYTFTTGTGTSAYADNAVAMGLNSTASGPNTFTAGNNSSASGASSVAFGRNSLSQGDYAFAAGNQARALGTGSISLGQDNFSSGSYSTSIGSFNNARSNNSTVIGYGLESNVARQIVLGRYNEPWSTDLLSIWGSTVPLLIVGNGGTIGTRSNALTILGSGFTGIGVDNPQERLHIDGVLRIGDETIEDGGSDILAFSSSLVPTVDGVDRLGGPNRRWLDVYATNGAIQTSDRREKENIQNLKYGLKEVLQMNPVSFNWKNKNNPDTKLGLIAQDVLRIIPEVVKTHIWEKDEVSGVLTKKELDRLGVYYSDLVPVLIKAIQEQQEIITNSEFRIQNYESEVSSLQSLVNTQNSKIEALNSLYKRMETLEALLITKSEDVKIVSSRQ